ncbi:MAG: ACT domain-containing protein [Oscillospiraceae bacterium]|nr:ACT domain-containing protein [Oscillospiraceae bacterium]
MLLKQISVFAENRKGAIRDITGVLFEAGVNLRAISIADTADFGVVRLIVDKRKTALSALRENGMTVKETDVLALEAEDTPGSFHKALALLTENDVMVEYSYGFVSPVGNGATIILKCDDQEKAHKCLLDNGFKLLSADDVKF